jgi:hypothetical protein
MSLSLETLSLKSALDLQETKGSQGSDEEIGRR